MGALHGIEEERQSVPSAALKCLPGSNSNKNKTESELVGFLFKHGLAILSNIMVNNFSTP